MSGFSFNNIQEVKPTVGTRASTGIHHFLVKSVEVETVKGKDNNPDWEKGVVTFEVTKTLVGKDSVGKIITYDIMFPRDQVGAEKLGKRLIHIFSKISTSDKVEKVKEAIQKLDLSSISTLVKGLEKIAKGRQLKLKVVGDQERKYPTIPLYFSGYAECIDVEPTQLIYSEEKEGLIQQPKGAENAKEDSSSIPSTDEGVPSIEDTNDELPF